MQNISTTAKIILDQYTFTAKGRGVVFDGYTKKYQSLLIRIKTMVFCLLSENEKLSLENVNKKKKF